MNAPTTNRTPTDATRRTRGSDRLARTGVRAGVSRSVTAWAFVAVWSLAVCFAHFGGLAYGTYYSVAWWDLLTHSTSGFGVAAIAYLLRPAWFRSRTALFVVLPVAVVVIGAGFEVYERLFRTFWHSWSVDRYVTDTLVDLVMDGLGAVALGVVVTVCRRRRRGRGRSN